MNRFGHHWMKCLLAVVSAMVVALAVDAETNITLRHIGYMRSQADWIPPARVSVPIGEKVVVSAPDIPGYVWFKNGVPQSSVTGNVLTLDPAKPDDAGSYFYDWPGMKIPESLGSQTLVLSVAPAQRFLNLSSRGLAGTGAQTLINGFVVSGLSEKTILLRVIGPSLAQFGVTGVLAAPTATVYDSSGKVFPGKFTYPRNGIADEKADFAAAAAKVGAFPIQPGTADFATIRPFPPGAYTIHVNSADGSTGVVLVELYEVPE